MPVQELNKFRRKMIKPHLPPQFTKLVDISDVSKNFFFCRLNCQYSRVLVENQTKSSLRDQTNLKRNTLKVNRSRPTTKPFQSLPEEKFRPWAEIMRVCQILHQKRNDTTKNPQQTTPTVPSQVNKTTYQHTRQEGHKGQQAPKKENINLHWTSTAGKRYWSNKGTSKS